MEADQLGRLRDILEASRLIASYVKDTTETDFRTDTQKQDAVIRRIEIIGEATAHLNEETRRAVLELPFRKMQTLLMPMLPPRQPTPTTPAQPRVTRPQHATYSIGQLVGALPAGCITPTVQGTTYYLCGNTWFSAAYGANGVYYRVVPGPGG